MMRGGGGEVAMYVGALLYRIILLYHNPRLVTGKRCLWASSGFDTGKNDTFEDAVLRAGIEPAPRDDMELRCVYISRSLPIELSESTFIWFWRA